MNKVWKYEAMSANLQMCLPYKLYNKKINYFIVIAITSNYNNVSHYGTPIHSLLFFKSDSFQDRIDAAKAEILSEESRIAEGSIFSFEPNKYLVKNQIPHPSLLDASIEN